MSFPTKAAAVADAREAGWHVGETPHSRGPISIQGATYRELECYGPPLSYWWGKPKGVFFQQPGNLSTAVRLFRLQDDTIVAWVKPANAGGGHVAGFADPDGQLRQTFGHTKAEALDVARRHATALGWLPP